MSVDDLIRACQVLGVHVVFLPFPIAGAYYHQVGLIVVDSRLSPARQRWVLAHEYVHALRGHDGPQPPHVEQRVDGEASRLLISPVEYAFAEHMYGVDVVAIAEELHVPEACVEAYQDQLECGRHADAYSA